jgi:hypothetical protein
MHKKGDNNYGASPDRTFNLCEDRLQFFDVVTGAVYDDLGDLCLLEIKTRAQGSLEPLAAITGSHVAQVQLQLECAEAKSCVLQSYLPETKKSRYFLIMKNDSYITCFTNACNAIITNEKYSGPLVGGSKYALELHNSVTGQMPTFENLLPLRKWANDIASSSREIQFKRIK